ncbi:hypothetical protein [Bifidobacterium phasiani]|uniref:Uncharacterized protein n=1 Tax=Bifidobacterium phasiani TaxID=2834431 RepID=A0ABS6W6G3_9BIFI|nr:hypothetical protein [Bifidobacterium phasiani]MBW3081952.1 hypothetical protein [Bifidobacterium phasiani]
MRLVNLVRNPKPVGTTGWSGSCYLAEAPSLSYADLSLVVTARQDLSGMMQAWAETVVDTTPGVRYVLSAYLRDGSSTGPYPMDRVLAVDAGVIAGSATYDGVNKRYTMTFTPSVNVSHIRLYAPSTTGQRSMFASVICCTETEYRQVQDLGLVYFDQSTMPRRS